MSADNASGNHAMQRQPLRRALRVSVASIIWTVATCATEVVIGLTHHILTLVAFGLAGVLDAAGSAALVTHFRHALRHQRMSERHERRATLVVSCGLLLLGLLTIVASVQRMAHHQVVRATTVGTFIAAMSVVVLAVLAGTKRHTGRRVDSQALVADGWLSASGALLAVLAVVGATAGSQRSLTWVDPTAALCIAVVAMTYGTAALFSAVSAKYASRADAG